MMGNHLLCEVVRIRILQQRLVCAVEVDDFSCLVGILRKGCMLLVLEKAEVVVSEEGWQGLELIGRIDEMGKHRQQDIV